MTALDVTVTVRFSWLAVPPFPLWDRTSCGKYPSGGVWSVRPPQLATEVEGLPAWLSDVLAVLASTIGSRTRARPTLGPPDVL